LSFGTVSNSAPHLEHSQVTILVGYEVGRKKIGQFLGRSKKIESVVP